MSGGGLGFSQNCDLDRKMEGWGNWISLKNWKSLERKTLVEFEIYNDYEADTAELMSGKIKKNVKDTDKLHSKFKDTLRKQWNYWATQKVKLL